MEENQVAIVIDCGSGSCKVGFASDKTPKAVFASIVGRPRHEGCFEGDANGKKAYIGEEAQAKRGILTLKHPIQRGIFVDWDDMEEIWHHIFYCDLKVDPLEYPVLLTEAPLNPKSVREKITQIMFETFGAPAIYIALQAFLSLFSSGRSTGAVLDSGYSSTHTVPIYENHIIPHAIIRMSFAGQDLTQYLMKILCETGYSLTTHTEACIANNIKEALCYVAQDFEYEIMTAADNSDLLRDYELSDGTILTLRKERFRCPETLFNPLFIGLEEGGIHKSLYTSILKCDADIRPALYGNILLAGGSTMFPGISERLANEIAMLAPPNMVVDVGTPPVRKHSSWIGGSMFATSESLQDNWITRNQYNEVGPSVIHDQCN